MSILDILIYVICDGMLIRFISEAGALIQKRDESETERIVRGVNHCRTALLAGYTTYR